MNKIYLVVITVMVLCVLECSGTTVAEFFNNLPEDISNAFSNAWDNMKKAIRKPVRIKRLGHGRRKKNRRNTTKPTTKATTATTTDATTVSSTYLMLKRLELPVLPTPRWSSLVDWKNLQKPRFALY